MVCNDPSSLKTTRPPSQTEVHSQPPVHVSLAARLWGLVFAVGPGIFCIGYTVGTGSVTTMCKAGAMVGLDLLWLLVACCVFMGFLMEAFGRFGVVTGQTAIHSFRTQLKGGPLIAILVVAGVVAAQYGAIMGILGLCSSMITKVLFQAWPNLGMSEYWVRLGVAIGILGILYSMVLVGTYNFFEKVLVFFVTLMGITFLGSMWVVMPQASAFAKGMAFTLPTTNEGFVLVPAMVGTTMAAATFVVRPLLMKGKGWGPNDRPAQTRDSTVAAILMLVISGAIMASATGALYYKGQTIEQVMDMVTALEPVAGKLAMALFFAGALSAGLSSLFPIMMIAPLLVSDYRNGQMETKTPQFRILCAVAGLVGLTVPILGFNPVEAQIVSQIGGVFVLPISIAAIAVLVNRPSLMGPHRAGLVLNIALATSFLFSLLITYTGCVAIAGMMHSVFYGELSGM